MDSRDSKRDGHADQDLSAYLDRELSAERASEVEAHLKSCSDCSNLLATMKKSRDTLERALRFTERDHIPVERLDAYRSKEVEEPARIAIETHLRLCAACRESLEHLSYLDEPDAKKRSLRLALVAAAAVLAVAAGVFLFESRSEREEILARLSQIDPPPYLESRPRSGALDAAAFERLENGMRAYLAADYAGAIEGLEPLVLEHPEIQQASFFLATCYLLTGENEPAVSLLESLAREPGPYAERARFYLAKAHLRLDDVGRAREELEAVLSMGGRYEGEARAILEELRRLR